jgi:predicted transcriptional regulator of viral defense system
MTLQYANEMMAENSGKTRLKGAAARFIDARLAGGRVAFPLADLVKETGLSATAARNQLLRLDSQIVRVSRMHQFFLIVGPEHRAVGAPPVAWWLDDYFSWLGHPYYLALQSAAGMYGSNPQALQVTQVMTDSPRRQIEAGRIRVRFFVKRGVERTSTQPMTNAFAPIRVSTPEATAFDLVRYASRIGGIGRVVETLVPLLPLMRASQLKRVLEAENEPATGQRLGYLLETADKGKLAETIHDWLPSQLALVPLVPSGADRTTAPVIARWRIINNSGEAGL